MTDTHRCGPISAGTVGTPSHGRAWPRKWQGIGRCGKWYLLVSLVAMVMIVDCPSYELCNAASARGPGLGEYAGWPTRGTNIEPRFAPAAGGLTCRCQRSS